MNLRKPFLLILLALLVFTCSCPCVSPIVSLGKWVVTKADEIAEFIFTEAGSSVWEDYRACLLDPRHPNPQVLLLKQYAPPEAGPVSPDFYTYFGFRDWWRFPLVYPYSILAVDTTERGKLVAASGDVDFRNPNEGLEDAGISDITLLTFDQKTLLVKTGETYQTFDFASRQVGMFQSEQELFDAAKKLQFQGEYRLMSIDEYNGLFTCTE